MFINLCVYCLDTFGQELCVAVVFTLSYMIHSRWFAGQKKGCSAKDSSRSAFSKPLRRFSRGQEAVGDHTLTKEAKVLEEQMLTYLNGHEYTRALNIYRTLERQGRDQFSEELFSAFMSSSIRVGKLDVIERMLRAMTRNGMTPSLSFCQMLLRMLSGRKHFSVCLVVEKVFGSKLPCDKVVYSCLINAALELGDASRAFEFLEPLRRSALDVKDYVLCFRTFVELDKMVEAEECFEALGSDVTTLMLNLLLLTCVNCRKPARAHDHLIVAHRLEGSRSDVRSCPIVDVVSYNTVIKGYTQQGQLRESVDLLREMLQHKHLQPDDITFASLFDPCITEQKIPVADQITELLGITDSGQPLDSSLCKLVIKALVRINCLPSAVQLLQDMQKRGDGDLDIVIYSTVIKACVDQRKLETGLKLVKDMQAIGLKPDDIIMTHLLEGCCHMANKALGLQLYQEMIATGTPPSEYTLVTLLKLLGRCGAHAESYELVSTWETKHGQKPSVIHYTCIMSGCLRSKCYNKAWAAYELMMEHGVKPDATCISTVLGCVSAGQQWSRLLKIAERLLIGGNPCAHASELNDTLRLMTTVGDPICMRYAKQLKALMLNAGMPVRVQLEDR